KVAGKRVLEGIAANGTRCAQIGIQEEGGTPAVFTKGVELLTQWRQDAMQLVREPAELKEFIFGLECGGSDTTSGLVANPAIGLVTDLLIDQGGTAIFS